MVQAASDGYEATQVFPEFEPDLVVLDMRMPKMSGPTSCAVIRQISQVTIIMFTSTNDATEVKDAILKGTTDFILKSTGVNELTDRIAFHLGKPPAGKNVSEANPVRKSVSATPTPSAMKATSTTLIIDPDEKSRAVIKAVLTRLNQNVIEASTAAEAIREFKQQKPEMIISEWSMPDMDGYSMLNEIAKSSNGRKLSKLIMSNRLTPEAERKAQFVGISDFLVKPLDGAKVEILVADAVRKALRNMRRIAKRAA
jgi:DNA-binding response OmpR family regulator